MKKSTPDPNDPTKDINGNPLRTRRYRKVLDIEHIHKQLMTVLVRDTEKLMDKSYRSKLSRDEATALIAYLKMVNEMKALDELNQMEKGKMAESPTESSINDKAKSYVKFT